MPELPVACTLTGPDRARRAAALAQLGADALLGVAALPDGVRLRLRPEAAARVQAVRRQEAVCCPFLALEVAAGPDAVELTVRAEGEVARAEVDALVAALARPALRSHRGHPLDPM